MSSESRPAVEQKSAADLIGLSLVTLAFAVVLFVIGQAATILLFIAIGTLLALGSFVVGAIGWVRLIRKLEARLDT